jgi:hypothetical protein
MGKTRKERFHFLQPATRASYDDCPLTALLRRMPKGGLLHLHSSSVKKRHLCNAIFTFISNA